MRKLLGPLSLANRNGADHKARRRVVGQLFASNALKRYSPAIVALVDELSGELLGGAPPLALVPKLRRFAFSVIASTVLGLDPADREALFVDFETWCQGLFSLPFALPGSPYARALQARQRLLRRLGAVLEKAQSAAAAGAPLAAGGLDLLAGGLDEAGLPLGDDDVAEQLLLLLFAGYETTASALSCLLLSLLQHPAELAWLQQELDGLPWPPAQGEDVTAFDAIRAPRLDAVVKEVMRLTPPVGASSAAPGSRLPWRMYWFRPIVWCRSASRPAIAMDEGTRIWRCSGRSGIWHATAQSPCCPTEVVSGSAWARHWPSWRSVC